MTFVVRRCAMSSNSTDLVNRELIAIIGATPEGKKELVGLIDGVRESAQSSATDEWQSSRRCSALFPHAITNFRP
jgi:transposase-like protein